ncbi:hypothetical protein AB0K00_53960 [Dactylosporangium sp. NPDC049525]|uniref:hypothetical protein n=1 Tax=Dactylosporangium sp. NPDC049525 TaxID=3154730 RepID=UPI00343F6764
MEHQRKRLTGALVGFAKLEDEPVGGVELVQFGEREPRDVLTDLLDETHLTFDRVVLAAAAR